MSVWRTTHLECEICKKIVVIEDDPNKIAPDGAEQVLRVTAADGSQLIFCGIKHLQNWAATYKCPLLPDSKAIASVNFEARDEVFDALTSEGV